VQPARGLGLGPLAHPGAGAGRLACAPEAITRRSCRCRQQGEHTPRGCPTRPRYGIHVGKPSERSARTAAANATSRLRGCLLAM